MWKRNCSERNKTKGRKSLMAQGVVKSYDPNSGSGIVLLDTDKTEVYIQPGSLKDSIFRTLRQGQRINFEIENIENSQVIKNVKIGQGDY